jgi:hypothetical protein
MFQCPFACPLDYGPVSHGIAEGDAQFDYFGPGGNRRQRHFSGNPQVRVAAGKVGDKSGLAMEV